MLFKKVVRFITFILMIVGAVFNILAIAGNSWENINVNTKIQDRSYHIGLWKVCENSISSKCFNREKTDALKATQAFMILGFLGYLTAFIFCALLHINKNFTINLLGVVLNTSALCLLIGLSVYTNQVSIREYKYGWSYIIGWISFLLTLVAGLLCYTEHFEYHSIK
uniref:Epithelial membrane protein 1 n=1 Tax=Hydra vulgaris TaxID=6087 RepID=T2MFM9_HYDVU|nr:epithelial membrane protein 1 [Hydra vulgaris]